MDSAYLQSTVGEALSEGLAATLIANPHDKVEYLAAWLRKRVAEKAGRESREKERAELARKDAERAKAESIEEQKASAAEQSKAQSAAEREKQFQTFLQTADDADTLLRPFLQLLRDLTGASSAYLARLEPTGGPDATPSLKYVAATPENEWIVDKRLDPKKGRVTFELFGEEEPEEEEPEEEDENGNPIPRVKKEKDPKSVFVPNVLLGPKSAALHFWKLPQLGSYVAVKLKFQGCVSDEALDEAVEREQEIMQLKREGDEAKAAAAKEAADEAAREAGLDPDEDDGDEDGEDDDDEEPDDDEDEEARARRARRARRKAALAAAAKDPHEDESEDDREARLAAEEAARIVEEEEFLLTQLQRPTVEYALCLDTLGQNRRFSDAQLATITRYAKALQAKLAALDRVKFTAERKRRAALVEYNREVAEGNESGTLRTEEERAEELERVMDELEASGRPMTAEDAAYKYRTDLILQHLKTQIAEWPSLAVFPRGNLTILQAALFLLGFQPKQVVDADGAPDWKRMRACFAGDTFFNRLKEYDPRATHVESVAPDQKHTESVVVGKLLSPEGPGNGAPPVPEYEEVKAKNYVLSEILLWVKDVLAVKRRAKLERAKAKRDEARKKAAAEAAAAEEAERKAAEAEAAAEAAENGEAKDEDEEEEEED